MLAGVKFLPRNDVEKGKGEKLDDSRKGGSKSKFRNKKEKRRERKKRSRHSSSKGEGLEKIKKRSRKKWYSSDENSSLSTTESDSEDSSDGAKKKEYGDSEGDEIDIVRKEMGLEWMLKPADRTNRNINTTDLEQQEEQKTEPIPRANPKELNPYLMDNGSGYPEEADHTKTGGKDKLLSSSLVGDGGASWRLKALKRAEEQAAREGLSLEEVAKERWGTLGHLAVSVASRSAAPSHAHLHAIRSRKMSQPDDQESTEQDKQQIDSRKHDRGYLKDVKLRHSEMKAPRVRDSLSWGKNKGQNSDAALIKNAVSRLNKFSNDGSFMDQFVRDPQKEDEGLTDILDSKPVEDVLEKRDLPEKKTTEEKQPLSANQLAAKALQLRMKGKHEEAEKLLKDAEVARAQQVNLDKSRRPSDQGISSRYVMRDARRQTRKDEDDSDISLAQRIMTNKKYSVSGQADDEYDYDDGPSRKSQKKSGNEKKLAAKQNFAKRIITQQERCKFCFENPNRPKHLVVSIANLTYLMLPQQQPVVPGHCCILPMHHESASRAVDNSVWEEIRNFKKCLIMMFAKQDKEMIFLETVMGLAQQRRHCLIECIPLPKEIAKQAPLYFKKAIDEAESEWSQHNAKRLIDTSEKGLRGSIPKNFPYFHVEFGINRGFVHVIDDEEQFTGGLGLNVIRGMMQLPGEDMYRRRRYDTVEAQKQAVASFAREWEPFDWTKQLDS